MLRLGRQRQVPVQVGGAHGAGIGAVLIAAARQIDASSGLCRLYMLVQDSASMP